MNKITSLILGGAALATVALVSAPMAAAPDGGRPRDHGAHMRGGFAGGAPLISIALKHKSELNLANDQVANLEKIKSDFQSKVTPLHQQVRGIENEIATLSQQSPANLIHIKAKIQEAEKYRSELRYLQVEAVENGRALLSSQQRDKLQSLVASRHENMRKLHKQPS